MSLSYKKNVDGCNACKKGIALVSKNWRRSKVLLHPQICLRDMRIYHYKYLIKIKSPFFFFFICIWIFFHNHSRATGLQGKGEGISLTSHYHFHPLHRHLDISQAITAESSPLHIGSNRTRTGKLWFPSVSR